MFQEIAYQDPLTVFAIFAEQAGALFLDSAELRNACGRYSFIAIDPFQTWVSQHASSDPLTILAKELADFSQPNAPDLPPFQGGVAGFFSYELGRFFEAFPTPATTIFPDLALGFYDLVMAFDEVEKRAWVFSNGFPERSKKLREVRATQRLKWMLEQLKQVQPLPVLPALAQPTPQITSHFTAASYAQAVQRVIDYILAGDIFEANISQCFTLEWPAQRSPFALYRTLRQLNPAPFAAYLNLANVILMSASPERFLKLQQGQVETRPIKGTCTRGKTIEQDQQFAKELMASEKDRAENTMIVDLLRNDLSRVCRPHSVQVPQLCGLESYATVHHLVSVVIGILQKDVTAIDLLRATFPGGSITGAPKIRAMEIIAEIEPTLRGPYCGSMGYIGFNGDMDTSITIRTFVLHNQQLTFQAGGAVVADSDPLAEYQETLTKAAALRRSLA